MVAAEQGNSCLVNRVAANSILLLLAEEMRASLYDTPEEIVTVSPLDLFLPTIEISEAGNLAPNENGELLSASYLTNKFPELSSKFHVSDFTKVELCPIFAYHSNFPQAQEAALRMKVTFGKEKSQVTWYPTAFAVSPTM